MSSWMKAGLIGIAAMFLITLLGLIPEISCLYLPLMLITYFVVGGLAASLIPPQTESSDSAKHGAMAAMLAALGGGIIGIITTTIYAITNSANDIRTQVPPEFLKMLRDSNIDPNTLNTPAVRFGIPIGANMICCTVWIFIAAILGAIGWIVYSSMNSK